MSVLLYACSTNAGKLKEFRLLSATSGYSIEPLPGLKKIAAPEENGSSFEENARIKATYYSQFTPELVFADDSGIEVDALGGKPGVHSARFAGLTATDQENNELLLSSLQGLHAPSARFVCVIALARSRQVFRCFEGSVEGTILDKPSGEAGFGYDPLFFYPPLQRSFAQLNPEQKLAISHRGQALRKLLQFLPELAPSG